MIARKDLKILTRRRSLMAALIVLPLFMGIGLPGIIEYIMIKKSNSLSGVSIPLDLLGAFGYFFVLLAVFLPLYLSSYSLVGEKVEKSIEPLLSTPTSDGEILIGKYIGAFIPAMLSIYFGAIVFMILNDIFTFRLLGYLFYPNLNFAIILLIAAPLACLYAISFSVFISGKVNDARTAYQLGVLSVLPFVLLYVLGEIGIVSLVSDTNILIISGALLLMTIVMYLISSATFKREEILLNWK
ncbi:MAG: ABC transporter permease subunit [Thermoplasmataceae archaeon]